MYSVCSFLQVLFLFAFRVVGPANPAVAAWRSQAQGQAFGGAAGLDELPERQALGREAFGALAFAKAGTRVVEQQCAAERHGVAAEAYGVRFVGGDALVPWNAAFYRCARRRVEGVGIIEQVAPGQRAEAGVQVIETRVDEPQRDGFALKRLRNQWRRLGVGA
jgi:hypothetical protein